MRGNEFLKVLDVRSLEILALCQWVKTVERVHSPSCHPVTVQLQYIRSYYNWSDYVFYQAFTLLQNRPQPRPQAMHHFHGEV